MTVELTVEAKSEALSGALMETIDEGMVIVTEEGRILFCNGQFAEMANVPVSEIQNSKWQNFFSPDERSVLDDMMARPDPARRKIVSLRRADDSKVVVQAAACVIDSPQGQLYLLLFSNVNGGERQLRDDKWFRLLLDQAKDFAIVIYDTSLRVTHWYGGARWLLGYEADEILGRPAAVFFVPDDIEAGKPARNFERAKSLGRFEDEGWRLRRDGTCFWADVVITALHNASGQIVGYSSLIRDISRRRQLEQLHDARNHIMQMIADRAPLHSILASLTRLVEAQADGMLCSVLFLDKEGKRLRHGAAPSLPRGYTEGVDGGLIGPCAGSCGTAAYRKQPVIVTDIASDPLWADYRDLALRFGLRACWSTPILGPTNNVLGTFAMYYHEPRTPGPTDYWILNVASAIARVAIEHQQADDDLVESRERFRIAFAGAAVGMCLLDLKGRFVEANAVYSTITGYPPDELIGMDFSTFTHPDDLPRSRELIAKMLEGQFRTFVVQKRYIPKQGGIVWVQNSVSLTSDAAGNPVNILIISEDITQRKEVEQALEQKVVQRTAKLRETVGDLEQYSYCITHDLRAPLRAIQGFAEILQEQSGAAMPPESQEILQRLTAAAHRMDKLIRDSLNYGKILQADMKPEPIDPAPLIREIIEAYPVLQPPKARVTVEGDLPRILGNAAALAQCVSNLLTNAVKFVAPGNSPRVIIHAEIKGDRVCLWFQDNGIGIPKDQQEKVFDIFQKLNPQYEGTGVGLAIVRKAVERMGGRVGVESEPGKGSRFWLELKRAV